MKILILTAFILISLPVLAQQDPLYSHYMLNPLLINPAYAGLNNNFNGMVGYRTQWTGFEGQPKTLSASAHSSLVNNKMGLGILLMNDKAGNITNTEINVPISYKLQFKESTFSFGMQVGIQNFRADNTSIKIFDLNDNAFGNGERGSRLNLGAGAILRNEKFLIGFSVPRLLPSTFSNGGQEFELYNRHMYLMAAYVYYLNEHVRLKPSLLIRSVKGAPLSTDIGMNINFNAVHTAGLFTRNLHTYGILLQTVVREKFKLGYAFEVPTNKSVGTQFTSHEITVGVVLSAFSFHEQSISNF